MQLFLCKVENRIILTLIDVLRNVILPNSVLHTDGFVFYPVVARNLNLNHHVVNHSEGFRLIDNTNKLH